MLDWQVRQQQTKGLGCSEEKLYYWTTALAVDRT